MESDRAGVFRRCGVGVVCASVVVQSADETARLRLEDEEARARRSAGFHPTRLGRWRCAE